MERDPAASGRACGNCGGAQCALCAYAAGLYSAGDAPDITGCGGVLRRIAGFEKNPKATAPCGPLRAALAENGGSLGQQAPKAEGADICKK